MLKKLRLKTTNMRSLSYLFSFVPSNLLTCKLRIAKLTEFIKFERFKNHRFFMLGKFYRFDKESLNYKQEKLCLKQKVKATVIFLSVSLVLASLILVGIFHFAGTPKLNRLQKRNDKLVTKIKSLDTKFTKAENQLAEISNKDDNFYRVITEAPAIPKSVRESGFGGSEAYAKFEDLKNADVLISSAKRLDKISKQAYIQSKSYDDILKLAQEKEKRFECFPAISPLPKKSVAYISDYYGWRIHPVHKRRIFHWGVDLSADIGTPVFAPGDGIVEEINYSSHGFGRLLTINHGYGLKTIYGHLSRFSVTKGQKVKRGDTIAFVGNAGITSGPHLHYGVIKNGAKINPTNFYDFDIPDEEYMQIISQKDAN